LQAWLGDTEVTRSGSKGASPPDRQQAAHLRAGELRHLLFDDGAIGLATGDAVQRLADLFEEAKRAPLKNLPGLAQESAFRSPREQPRAKLGLKLGNGMRQGWLGQTQHLCRARQGVRLRRRIKGAQAPQARNGIAIAHASSKIEIRKNLDPPGPIE